MERRRTRERDSGDDEQRFWIVDLVGDRVVAPIRLRGRRVLEWRSSTRLSTGVRIERLRRLERCRCE
ncbi:peptidase M48 Ste24p [Natronobacterium gregoryi SP2]|uniref:Peptidase M48 Ste24p n=1 Tax=Natronobacterium gregoryi (strain ATCC 43098 / DSM 3393 / CCM 3738 / CIP 104747 / IAM 13177 / JCM 8860 / NBRC 102187 / NCIMB 2189 / SP2) TaxID=797304 RepID=L9XLS4_NATGS|nr:peptidase M48 Ste24p [Natronobacterium gregoryi SP2]